MKDHGRGQNVWQPGYAGELGADRLLALLFEHYDQFAFRISRMNFAVTKGQNCRGDSIEVLWSGADDKADDLDQATAGGLPPRIGRRPLAGEKSAAGRGHANLMDHQIGA